MIELLTYYFGFFIGINVYRYDKLIVYDIYVNGFSLSSNLKKYIKDEIL